MLSDWSSWWTEKLTEFQKMIPLDMHQNRAAIEFDSSMVKIPLHEVSFRLFYIFDPYQRLQFKQSDYDLLPKRFQDDCMSGIDESCGLETKEYDYIIKPSTFRCNTASVVVTVKSAADHFGESAGDYPTRLNIFLRPSRCNPRILGECCTKRDDYCISTRSFDQVK